MLMLITNACSQHQGKFQNSSILVNTSRLVQRSNAKRNNFYPCVADYIVSDHTCHKFITKIDLHAKPLRCGNIATCVRPYCEVHLH